MRNYFLETGRIAFSRWTQDDYDLALLLWGDESVTKHISETGKFTEQEIKDRLLLEIENQKISHVQYWPIFEKATEEFIGCCGLRPYNLEERIYGIGFHLRSTHWGKGFASEAARAIIQYSLDHFNASSLIVGHIPKNTVAQKILKKLGFEYLGDMLNEPTGLYYSSYKYSFHKQALFNIS